MINKIKEYISNSGDYISGYIKEKTMIWSLNDIYPYIDLKTACSEKMEGDVVDYLGQAYERLIPNSLKKDLGQFYTRNTAIIDKMISSVDIYKGKILEPSCGSGCFIVAIINKLIKTFKSQDKSAEEIIDYITENIYINDNDEIALKITEINIIGTLVDLLIEAKANNEKFTMKKLKQTSIDFTRKDSFDEKFDVVIGNPPFVTMYGKRSRNMTEEKRAYFNTFDFVQNKKGNNKFNIAMFFVENGMKLLNPNGQLAYIMDISFFETAFLDLRKYIVKNYYIESITTGLQEFENVASGQMLLNLKNTPRYNDRIEVADFQTKRKTIVNQSVWDNEITKYRFYIPLAGLTECINSKIEQCNLLEYYFPGKALRTCCALTGKTEEFIVDPSEETTHDVFPYIEGSKGLKGKFNKPTISRYIKYDYDLQIKLSNEFKEELAAIGVKNKKRVTLGDKDAYLAPKVFIRQSANEIIATYSDEPYAANNSIYILTTKSTDVDSVKMLKYTCGLLNSELLTFFCKVNRIIRCDKGKTPQIKISDLKNVRINVDKRYYEELIEIVECLLKNPDDICSYSKLNDIVYKIYNIDDEEQEFIKDYLTA